MFLLWNVVGLVLWVDVVFTGTQMLSFDVVLFFYIYFGMTGCVLCCTFCGLSLIGLA